MWFRHCNKYVDIYLDVNKDASLLATILAHVVDSLLCNSASILMVIVMTMLIQLVVSASCKQMANLFITASQPCAR